MARNCRITAVLRLLEHLLDDVVDGLVLRLLEGQAASKAELPERRALVLPLLRWLQLRLGLWVIAASPASGCGIDVTTNFTSFLLRGSGDDSTAVAIDDRSAGPASRSS